MRHPAIAMLLAGTLAVSACNRGHEKNSEELLVFAAASLTDAFNEIEKAYESSHPGVSVEINFAGSQSLRTQIENGALPAVFASANEKHVSALVAKDLASEPKVFAYNRLVLAVPAANPAQIESLADLVRAKRLVLAGKSVPAGAYADEVLERAGQRFGGDFSETIAANLVSRENHVRQTLQKVVLGEADAALVYATDASAAGDTIKSIAIPEDIGIRASYPIVHIKGSKGAARGKELIDFVLSAEGATILRRHGFETP